MANILYMTQSSDGYIAKENDETPWSAASWESFQEFVKSCSVVLLGRRTYQIMLAGNEFVEGPEYFVVTNDYQLDTGEFKKLSITSKADIPVAERLGIIGGGDLNGRLAMLDVIDEIIIDTEQINLNSGVKLFGKHAINLKLELISKRSLDIGVVQCHYKVLHR